MNDKIATAGIFYYSVLCYFICLAIRVPGNLIKYLFRIQDIQIAENLYQKLMKIDTYIDTLLLAPLLETLLFQAFFFFLYQKFIKNKIAIITLSGAAFGIIHSYSVFYMIDTFLIGLFFMYAYIRRAEQENKPYISTVIAHAFMNAITLGWLHLQESGFILL